MRPVPRLLVSVGVNLSDVAPLPNRLGSISPARHSTVVKDGAGVVFSGRERYCCATCTKAAGERGSGFVRCPPITQSAVTSLSPARHSTVVKDGAGVGISGRERYCCATRTETARECGCGFVRPSSITQLAVTSVSPTRHSTVVKDGAGVVKSGRERYCCATRTEAAYERGCGFGRCSSIAQLAVTSVSPARHSTVVEDGAGVESSGRERYCCATRTETARECGCGFVRRCTITQLAVGSSPQHDAEPLSRMAQVWNSPEESVVSVKMDPS